MTMKACGHEPAFIATSALAIRRGARMCVETEPRRGESDSKKRENATPMKRRANLPVPRRRSREGVQSRPELVGGVPLWLLLGAMSHVRTLARALNVDPAAALRKRQLRDALKHDENTSHGRERGNTANSDANVGAVGREGEDDDTDLSTPAILRATAAQIDEELATLRAALEAARAERRNWERGAEVAREDAAQLRARLSKEGTKLTNSSSSATMRRLYTELSKAQTRTAAAHRQRAELEQLASAVGSQRDFVREDAIKIIAVSALFFVIASAYFIRSPLAVPLMEYLHGRST